MMMRLSAAALALVLIAGCSNGGTSDTSATTEPMAVAEPTSITTLTTLPPTTVTTTTTTTTEPPPPPWTLVEYPDWPDPILSEDLGGPLTTETMCVEFDLVGIEHASTPGDPTLKRQLEYLGIETVDYECDITLAISAVGSRTSARYQAEGSATVQTCWEGQRVDGEVALLVDGRVMADWPIDVSEPAPEKMRGCSDKGEPLSDWHWKEVAAAALMDMYGPAPAIAAVLVWGDEARERFKELRETAGYAEVLAAGLGHPVEDVRSDAAGSAANWAERLTDYWSDTPDHDPIPDTLWSTIPYLIACDEFTEPSCSDALRTLQLIFFRSPWDGDIPDGFDVESQADWWELWEANPTAPEG